MTTVRLTVHGDPQPAGSKRAFMRPGMRYPVITDDNPRSRGWKDQIAKAVAEQYGGEFLDGALEAEVHFFQVRPKGHYGTGRNAGVLKDWAPIAPIVKPDIDKLSRAVLDGLTGQLFRDDAQIVEKRATKHYGEPARVEIMVSVMEQQTVGNMVDDAQLDLAAA
jgi:Holliday junction resolvase RusA-like endonuclease